MVKLTVIVIEEMASALLCSYSARLTRLQRETLSPFPPGDRLLQWKRKWEQPGSVENMLSNILWGTDTHMCAVKS